MSSQAAQNRAEVRQKKTGSKADQRAWHKLDVDSVLSELETGREGLSEEEAEQRLERYGPNRIGEQREISAWQVLLHQLKSPLVYVLLGALAATIATSLYTGDTRWGDAIVIALVLVVNTTVGFFQEYRAENAVKELMKMVSPKATVRRGGESKKVEGADLVPGDVVEIGEGDVAPADLRLMDLSSLQINEAALTGESAPVNKSEEAMEDADEQLPPADRKNMGFMGTSITSGHGAGIVVATGQETKIGEIAEQVEEAGETQTPLQRRIQQLAMWITWGILVVSGIAFAVGLLMGRDPAQMMTLAVALAVAAIPAGLPIVVTVALAIGVRRMAERHAVIRHLPAVDTLGSCTTIVSDKTGTLTQNKMTVRAVYAGGERFNVTGAARSGDGGYESGGEEQTGEAIDVEEKQALYETLLVGLLCNNASAPGEESEPGGEDESGEKDEADPKDQNESGEEERSQDDDESDKEPGASGDPIEIALLYAGRKAGLDRDSLEDRYPRIDEEPFQTERRFMATIHEVKGDDDQQGPLVAIKGAPEAVLDMCSKSRSSDGEEEDLDRDAVMRANDSLAGEGLRVLAMAIGRGESAAEGVRQDEPPSNYTFVGLQGMLDPPRPSTVEAVDGCHNAGIRVIMVTGDHARTASAIAKEVHVDRPAEAQRREQRKGSDYEGGSPQSEVRVRYDARGLPQEYADSAAERLVVDTHLREEQDVRVRVEIGHAGQEPDSDQPKEDNQQVDGSSDGQQGELPEAHTGLEIKDFSDEELDDVLGRANVFARVEPIQKTRMVDRLKARNHIVAVTGDGVNDAPALKAAHVGAAMGSGTDVAKEASDMVITDDDFASVYRAVELGRTAFRNIRMAAFFLLSTGAAMVLVILSALALGWPLPLLPAQVLWCNVVTNGIADVALAFEPGEKALYGRPPRPPSEGVLDRTLLERLVLIGIWLAAGTLAMFLWKWGFNFSSWAEGSEENLTVARTAALTTMVLFQKVHVLNCRSEDVSIFRKSLLANQVLFAGVLASLGVHIAAMYIPWTQNLLSLVPLDAGAWAAAAGMAATAIVVNELHKWLRPRFR